MSEGTESTPILQAVRAPTRTRTPSSSGGHAERVVLYADSGFDWQALRHHLDSPSLFSPTRLIELCLGESGPGVQGSKAIIACAERPPTGDVVLITASGLDAKARQSAWYRALDRAGVVIETRPVSPAMLPRWIMERARRLGPTLEHEAAAFLSERVENNPLAANQEIEKLAFCAPGGRIGLAELQGATADNSRYHPQAVVLPRVAGYISEACQAVRLPDGAPASSSCHAAGGLGHCPCCCPSRADRLYTSTLARGYASNPKTCRAPRRPNRRAAEQCHE